jgi:O-antigen ligase
VGRDRADQKDAVPALTLTATALPRVLPRARRRPRLGLLERAFAFVVLFLSTGGLLPLLRMERVGAGDDLEGDPVMQMVWMAVYGITLVLLARRAGEIVRGLGRERWLFLLCALAALSVLWSVAPGMTFRRTAALLGTTGFGLYLASRYTVSELLRLVGWVLGGAAVLSMAAVAFAPAYGISDDGAWRGIFVHKNALGRAMALATVALLFQLRQRGLLNRLVTVSTLALAIVTLFGSHSVAGVLTAVVVAVLVPIWGLFRLRSVLAIAATLFALIALTIAAVWVALSPELAMATVGKDTSLTGRAGLWTLAIEAISHRPWLGHGYSAFWLGWDGESAPIWSVLTWRPPHAHNGVLDLALELGLVGVVLFAGGFLSVAWRAAGVVRRTTTAYGVWPITYVVFMLVSNLVESTMLVRNSIFWVFYIVTCMWLAQPRGDDRTLSA